MALLAYAPFAFVIGGVVKAVAILWAGPRLGIPNWMAATAAMLWVVGPIGALWLWKRRQQFRASVGDAARPESAG